LSSTRKYQPESEDNSIGNDLQKGTTYATGGAGGQGVITSANLNAHVDDAILKPTFISSKAEKTTLSFTDQVILESSGSLYRSLLSTILPTGSVIQTVVAAPYTANANLAVIPNDDTIPQNTEGTQILTLNITPQFSTSQIRLFFNGFGSITVIATLSAALFRGGLADALNATQSYVSTANGTVPLSVEWVDSPATTAMVTYSIRAGSAIGQARMNGSGAARVFGGKAACTLVAQEIKA
jgi:hypothetical protein